MENFIVCLIRCLYMWVAVCMSAAGIIPFCDCIRVIRALKRRARTKKARIDFYSVNVVSSNAIDLYGAALLRFCCYCSYYCIFVWLSENRAMEIYWNISETSSSTQSQLSAEAVLLYAWLKLWFARPHTRTRPTIEHISSKLIKRCLIHAIKYKACPAFRKFRRALEPEAAIKSNDSPLALLANPKYSAHNTKCKLPANFQTDGHTCTFLPHNVSVDEGSLGASHTPAYGRAANVPRCRDVLRFMCELDEHNVSQTNSSFASCPFRIDAKWNVHTYKHTHLAHSTIQQSDSQKFHSNRFSVNEYALTLRHYSVGNACDPRKSPEIYIIYIFPQSCNDCIV